MGKVSPVNGAGSPALVKVKEMSDTEYIEYIASEVLKELHEAIEELEGRMQKTESEMRIVYDIARKMLIEVADAVEGSLMRINHDIEAIPMLYEARRLAFITYSILSKYKHDEELTNKIERIWDNVYDLYYRVKNKFLSLRFK